MIASEELAAVVPGPSATATKTPFPYATPCHPEELDKLLPVQVMPSGDVAAELLPHPTALKTPFPKAIECQPAALGNVLVVQGYPEAVMLLLVRLTGRNPR